MSYFTRRFMIGSVFIHCFMPCFIALAGELAAPKLEVPYGEDQSVGQKVEINGIQMYYEIHGDGRPMLLIHGNTASIAAMGYQIEFFSQRYRVITADSRGHGKTDMGPEPLTFQQMAEDTNAFLDKLGLKQVYVFGWSDGGIIGLLLAIHHPDKVSKLAIMGANLNPHGAYSWAYDWVTQREIFVDEMIAKGDTSQSWSQQKQHLGLCIRQPNISVEAIQNVATPTLVMAADKDVIRDEHTLQIFHALPNAQLCIFPGATHMIPWEDPELLNNALDRFFTEPFSRPDTKSFMTAPPNQP